MLFSLEARSFNAFCEMFSVYWEILFCFIFIENCFYCPVFMIIVFCFKGHEHLRLEQRGICSDISYKKVYYLLFVKFQNSFTEVHLSENIFLFKPLNVWLILFVFYLDKLKFLKRLVTMRLIFENVKILEK